MMTSSQKQKKGREGKEEREGRTEREEHKKKEKWPNTGVASRRAEEAHRRPLAEAARDRRLARHRVSEGEDHRE
jgi:hypothetical protein